jgi:hypothetical protein
MKCSCGNNKFYAKQLCFVDQNDGEDSKKHLLDVLVTGKGSFVDNVDPLPNDWEVIGSDKPEGPFVCTQCGENYEHLLEECLELTKGVLVHITFSNEGETDLLIYALKDVIQNVFADYNRKYDQEGMHMSFAEYLQELNIKYSVWEPPYDLVLSA